MRSLLAPNFLPYDLLLSMLSGEASPINPSLRDVPLVVTCHALSLL
jgi:hypothetical protein